MSAKPELMLHIGMGKTGTTALQHFFWENRRELERRGVTYPSIGAVSKAHHLISPHVPAFLAGGDWKFLQPADWVDKVAALKAPRVLMSSELIAWAAPEIVAAFCAALHLRFDLKICLYLRRQDNIIMAGYNQQIKAGTQVLELSRVLGQQKRRFDYLARIVPWELAVGAENLVIRAYERQQFLDGDLIKDFLSGVLGVTDWAGLDFDQGENSNPRFTRAALDFKRLINVIYQAPAETDVFNEALIEFSAREGSGARAIFFEQNTLTWGQRDEILNLVAPSNAYIARKFLGRDDGVLFREDLGPQPAEAEADEVSPQELREVVAFLQAERPRLLAALIARTEAQMISGRKVLAKTAREMARLLQPPAAAGQPPAKPQPVAATPLEIGARPKPLDQVSKPEPTDPLVEGLAKARQDATGEQPGTQGDTSEKVTLREKMAAKKAARAEARVVAKTKAGGAAQAAIKASAPPAAASTAYKAAQAPVRPLPLVPQGADEVHDPRELLNVGLPQDRDLVVHFGVRKTGSTSIQETLSRNPGPGLGYFYPDIGRSNGTMVLQNAFANVEALNLRRRLGGQRDREKTNRLALGQLTSQLAKAPAGVPVILSSEALDRLTPEDFSGMVRSLDAQARSLRFIGYIREPVSYLRSAFQESLKHGFPKRNMFLMPEDESLGKGYHEIVNQLDRMIGRERVDARAFDRANFPGGDVVTDFLTRAGIDPGPVKVHRVNEGLSALAVKLLYMWRKFTDAVETDAKFPKSRLSFIAAMSELGGPGLVIHPKLEDRLEADNRHIYDWAAERLDVPLVPVRNRSDQGLLHEADLLRLSDEEQDLFAAFATRSGARAAPSGADPQALAAVMQDIRLGFVTPAEKLRDVVRRGRTALAG